MTNCVRDECSHLKIECCYEVSLLIKVGEANTRLAAGFPELLSFLQYLRLFQNVKLVISDFISIPKS